jgi:hypothetical protein
MIQLIKILPSVVRILFTWKHITLLQSLIITAYGLILLEEFGDKYGYSASRFAPTMEATASELYEQELESIIK